MATRKLLVYLTLFLAVAVALGMVFLLINDISVKISITDIKLKVNHESPLQIEEQENMSSSPVSLQVDLERTRQESRKFSWFPGLTTSVTYEREKIDSINIKARGNNGEMILLNENDYVNFISRKEIDVLFYYEVLPLLKGEGLASISETLKSFRNYRISYDSLLSSLETIHGLNNLPKNLKNRLTMIKGFQIPETDNELIFYGSLENMIFMYNRNMITDTYKEPMNGFTIFLKPHFNTIDVFFVEITFENGRKISKSTG